MDVNPKPQLYDSYVGRGWSSVVGHLSKCEAGLQFPVLSNKTKQTKQNKNPRVPGNASIVEAEAGGPRAPDLDWEGGSSGKAVIAQVW